MSREIKDLTDRVIKEHRPVERHWHGEGPYHCICGAEIKATSEDGLRWIFQFHCVSEGITLAQREIERLLDQEREKVREKCAVAVCEDCASGYKLLKSSTIHWEHEVPAATRLGNAVFVRCEAYKIRQLDLTKPASDLAAKGETT